LERGQLFILTFLKKAKKEKSEKMKILLIDDNEDLLELFENFLTSVGHEYTGISDGRSGLKAIQDEKFDVVFLDLSMPEFSGQDVIDALVKDGIMNKQKVVIFTATTPTKKDIELYLAKGVHSVLRKPMDVEQFTAYVQKVSTE